MEEWKQKLFDSYVSTKQAGQNIGRESLDGGFYHYLSRIIKKHLPQDRDISVADLACGYGRLIYCLKKHGYHNIQGVDISNEQVELSHKFGLNEVRCQNIDAFLDEKINTFDVLFLIDILEHLDKGQLLKLLDKVNSALRFGGIVVIHVPNAEGIFGGKSRYSDLTHETSFTSQSISQALTACGFTNVRCFEDKPVIHGLPSFVRYVLWQLFTLPYRILLLAETGIGKCILSQNMLVSAEKK
jgi:2-polyprenyl-3-methyl-5-hydroxy-6-metoxy-1,4-benzoquinol methylase